MIDPRDALVHIRTLVRATDDIDDPELLRRHLKEIAGIVENALKSGAIPNQMYPRQQPTRRD